MFLPLSSFICSFYNVGKCKDLKYSLYFILQDYLDVLCNKNNSVASLKSYLNTDSLTEQIPYVFLTHF